jgi:hypothetical protein
LSTFKLGDPVRVTEFAPDPALVGAAGRVVEIDRTGKYAVSVMLQDDIDPIPFKPSELELVAPLVSMIHTEPKVSIDLKPLNKDYNAPLVITVEKAYQLLRELDAVLLP